MNDADFDNVLQTAFPFVDVMKKMAGLMEALVTCDNSTENQDSSKKMSAMEKQKRARAEYEAKEGIGRKRRRTSKKKA